MHHRDLLLEALNYSTPISKHLDQQEQFATLVLWLENTKVATPEQTLPLQL